MKTNIGQLRYKFYGFWLVGACDTLAEYVVLGSSLEVRSPQRYSALKLNSSFVLELDFGYL